MGRSIFLLLLLFSTFCTYASHIVGGGMYYQYDGDTVVGGTAMRKYAVTLELYIDCANGQPEAIQQDDPAFLSIYNEGNGFIMADTSLRPAEYEYMPGVQNPCGWYTHVPGYCLKRKVYNRTYLLELNKQYTISYQRCCLSKDIVNIQSAGEWGVTISCTIPKNSNSSAVFVADPTVMVCLNESVDMNLSAVDADGDSLSYELCSVLSGVSDADLKPIPKAPPYPPLAYNAPYDINNQMPSSPAMALNAETGMLTVAPGSVGRYLLAVSCIEWRDGVRTNTVLRYFQVTVFNCAATPLPATSTFMHLPTDVAVKVGKSIKLHEYGGKSYEWSPATYLDNPHAESPTGTFPIIGRFSYVVKITSDSGCVAFDTVLVNVIDHNYFVVPSAFSPNADNLNDYVRPIMVGNAMFSSFSIFNRKGQKIFEDETGNKGWDGTYNGVPQDAGTYYWQLYYFDPDGDRKAQLEKGDVTLIR